MRFLTAEWKKLALVNYAVPSEVLLPYVPKYTELDIWEDKCFVSLVGFMFQNTKLGGVPIPFHREFEEVNLRFYVKHYNGNEWKRGVVFLKELVPKRALSLVANTFYKEHYQTVPMKHEWKYNSSEQNVYYKWKMSGQWHTLQLSSSLKPVALELGSHEEFIAEHYWGYTKVTPEVSYEYEVSHPKWEIYPVNSTYVHVDFASVYGPSFGFLNEKKPYSSILAEGSEISVKSKRKVRPI